MAVAAGPARPSTLIWKGMSRKAPDTPLIEVTVETANATVTGTQEASSMPASGEPIGATLALGAPERNRLRPAPGMMISKCFGHQIRMRSWRSNAGRPSGAAFDRRGGLENVPKAVQLSPHGGAASGRIASRNAGLTVTAPRAAGRGGSDRGVVLTYPYANPAAGARREADDPDRQRLLPARPPLREHHPEGSVPHPESQTSATAGLDERRDLLPQGKVLERKLPLRPEQRPHRPEEGPE